MTRPRQMFWQEKLKRTSDESTAMMWAISEVDRLDRIAAECLSEIRPDVREGIRRLSGSGLDAELIVRLFIVFESALREAWRQVFRKQTRPNMEPLIDAIAARTGISDGVRLEVHCVRKARNDFVHEGETPPALPHNAKSSLATFLSWIQIDWPVPGVSP